MKKHLQLAVSLSALVAYAAIVCVGYFHARAEIADEACGVDCLVQRVDCYHRRNSSGNFAIIAAICRASRRRDGICADVVQSSTRSEKEINANGHLN
jgi:hypothetical protein